MTLAYAEMFREAPLPPTTSSPNQGAPEDTGNCPQTEMEVCVLPTITINQTVILVLQAEVFSSNNT